MSRRQRILTQAEIDAILFDDTDESDFDIEEDDGWGESSMSRENVESSIIEAPLDEVNEPNLHSFDEDREISWTDEVKNENMVFHQFENKSGPQHNLPVGASPLEYLKLFLTHDVIDSIRLNTNKYAEFCAKQRGSNDSSWTPVENEEELWTFFAILLIMSVNHVPRITDYWSTNPILGNEMIKSLMSRNRFSKIKHYFHVSNKEEEKKKDDEEFTYTQKVEPFMHIIKEKCKQHFKPYKSVSIDEALIKFKGRLGIVQYMPLKPDKRGLKIWMMCTSHLGYTLNFDLYSGKNGKMNRSKKGLGYDVVSHLTASLNRGHEIYFDRFFTGIDLMIDLHEKGISSCGTVMLNRKKNAPRHEKYSLDK